MKNLQAKMRPVSNPYEVWEAPGWKWKVLKKWQANDDKPFARWFCSVDSPYVTDERGDVYVQDITTRAWKVTA